LVGFLHVWLLPSVGGKPLAGGGTL
jgi:hypothetical protein